MRCLKLAEEPWFYVVMGNHEAMQEGAYYGSHVSGRSVMSMCEYARANDPRRPGKPDQEQMEAILKGILLAMEIPLRDGRRVGFRHAGLPAEWTWHDVREIPERDGALYEKDRPGYGIVPAHLPAACPLKSGVARSRLNGYFEARDKRSISRP